VTVYFYTRVVMNWNEQLERVTESDFTVNLENKSDISFMVLKFEGFSRMGPVQWFIYIIVRASFLCLSLSFIETE